MRRKLLLSAGLSVLAVNAYADSGKVEICRESGIKSITDHKAIPLPAGTEFVTSPKFTANEKHPAQIWIKLDSAVQIPASAKCVVATATATRNSTGGPITQGAHPLAYSGSQIPIPGLPFGVTSYIPDIEAHVVSAFK